MITKRAITENDSQPNQSSFTRIKQAILEKKYKEIQTTLRTNPELLLEKDNKQNTLFHIAAQECHDKNMLVLMMTQLIQLKKFDHIISATNAEGKTPLHIAVMFNTYNIIKEMINKMGTHADSVMKMCDLEHKTPFKNLFDRKNINKNEKYKIFRLLKSKSIPNTTVKLSDAVNVCTQTDDERIKNNFNIANEIINDVRKIVRSSYTHPEANNFSNSQFNELITNINNFRATIKSTEFNDFEALESYAKKIEDIKIGNCGEIADLVLHRLRKNYPNIKSARVYIRNGNHCFDVIDLDPNYDSYDYKTWGKYAVICDAWAGKAYQVKDIEKELEAYTNLIAYNHNYNLLIKFNPGFHKLEILDNPPQTIAVKSKRKIEAISTDEKGNEEKEETNEPDRKKPRLS